MNEKETKFLELANKYEDLKKKMKEVGAELEASMLELGIGHELKDSNGIAYRIEVPQGTYVYFKKIDFVRGKKEGEVKGTLSKKENDEIVAKLSK